MELLEGIQKPPKVRTISAFSIPMYHLKRGLNIVRENITTQDMDYFMVVEGRVGTGKSTLALQICKYVDPTFSAERVVFSIEDFKNQVFERTKGQAILIDEGTMLMFSRDAMRAENKELMQLLHVIRAKNLFICICTPAFHFLDEEVRWRTVLILLVKQRGLYHIHAPREHIDKIYYDSKTRQWMYPYRIWRETFNQCPPALWNAYIKKKGSVLDRIHFGLLTTGEVAEKLGVDTRTVERWCDSGQLKGVRTMGNQWRIPLEEVHKPVKAEDVELREGGLQ